MKSASVLAFAGAVAAADYGYGYAAPSSSSKSSPEVGYPTINPGYGKEPVTVTAQYQAIPTHKSDGSWGEYSYVSTVISDYDGKKTTITKTEQPVTVYHTKTTYTKTSTEYGYAAPTGYGYGGKNGTTKTVYELYEKVHEVPYKDLGPHALPGYPGSGLYKGDSDKQPMKVKEYKNGKWSEYDYTFNYGAPKPEVTTYATPGVYTVPAKDITVDYTTTVPAEGYYTAPAGKPVTYGGAYTDVEAATTITAAYGAYETKGAETKTVIKYTTITCPGAGHYTVAKPTVTSYDHETTVAYPTAHTYTPGVYHHSAETVTITKSNEPYTCKYSQTGSFPTPTGYPVKPTVTKDSYPTAHPTPSGTDSYPTETPSATTPHGADPSSDYEEPAESYGKPYAGYVKRGGVLERRKAEPEVKKAAGKRVILV